MLNSNERFFASHSASADSVDDADNANSSDNSRSFNNGSSSANGRSYSLFKGIIIAY